MKTTLILLLTTFAYTLAFSQRDFSKVEIKPEKVNDKIYKLEGSGGNIGILIGDDGVFMIDHSTRQKIGVEFYSLKKGTS